LKTARAWALKETAMAFFNYVCENLAQAFSVVVQLGGAKSIRTDEREAAMLKRRFENIITLLRTSDYQCCQ
jgi:predicted nucleic acid-binding Zn ribbon protein